MPHPNSTYEYAKYSLKAAPIFLAIIVFADIFINERYLNQINAQHQRDIALSINNAAFVIDAMFSEVNDRSETEARANNVVKSFSKLPGVGCVSLSAGGLNAIYPPESFCTKMDINGTVTSNLEGGGILTFYLDDKYLKDLEKSATENLIFASALIFFSFMLFNFLAFKFVFEAQLKSVVLRNRKLFETSPVAQVEISEDGNIIQASIRWIEVFGDHNKNVADYIAEYAKKGFFIYINELVSGDITARRQNFPFIDKQERTFSGSVEAYHVDNNERSRIILAVHNVEDMATTIAEKEKETRLDALTGINSRRAFEQDSRKLLLRDEFVLGFFDIDNFKSVNDLYGYAVGDQVIVEAARFLAQSTPSGTSVYRLGGEEFICVAPKGSAKNFNWKGLVVSFSEIVFESGLETFSRSLSGCVLDISSYSNMSDSLKACEALVSKAKASGGNKVILNNDEGSILVDAHSMSVIISAIEEDQIYFEFQSIYDTMQSEVVGVEALVRWKYAGSVLYPSSFIRSYYKATFSKELSKLRHLEFTKRLSRAQLNKKLYVSYNIAIEDIISGRHTVLIDVLKPFLGQYTIVLELSEEEFDRRMTMSDMTEVLQELSRHGFKIALDDFGKRSSNFNRFIEIPIDFLKVDLELVRSIETSAKKRAVMRALVDVCNEFDVTIVAEGVETEAERNVLENIGVHLHQGFLYSATSKDHQSV